MNIVALGGSLRSNSLSAAALKSALAISHWHGANTELLDLRTLELPLYVPDLSLDSRLIVPKANGVDRVADLVRSFRHADVMIWASPTYHGAMSGALKNAIDYMQYLADDPTPYLQGKAVGLISIGDASPLAQMADCVHELRAWLAPTRLILHATNFSSSCELVEPGAIRRLTRLVQELLRFKRTT